MNPGRMNARINFLKQTEGKDKYGDPSDKWIVANGGIWASKEPILGNEFFAAFTTGNKVDVKFRSRFIPGITSDMRIMDGDETYEIIGPPINVKSLNKELLCYCRLVNE